MKVLQELQGRETPAGRGEGRGPCRSRGKRDRSASIRRKPKAILTRRISCGLPMMASGHCRCAMTGHDRGARPPPLLPGGADRSRRWPRPACAIPMIGARAMQASFWSPGLAERTRPESGRPAGPRSGAVTSAPRHHPRAAVMSAIGEGGRSRPGRESGPQLAMSTSMPRRSNSLASLSLIPSSVMKECTTSRSPSRVNEDLLILVESATR